jgi:ATP-dependent RNA helicase DDX23/PRP28
MQAVDRAGYKKPSPIQMAAIPLGLQFRDVIGIAGELDSTGTMAASMLTPISAAWFPHLACLHLCLTYFAFSTPPAETGSGKTAAFVLPMLVYIQKQPPMLGHPEVEAEGPYAVVLAPTRELAQQVRGMAAAWLYHAHVTMHVQKFSTA